MEDGVISDMGSYEELLYRKGAFAEFLQSVLLHDDTTDDEEDPEGKIHLINLERIRYCNYYIDFITLLRF